MCNKSKRCEVSLAIRTSAESHQSVSTEMESAEAVNCGLDFFSFLEDDPLRLLSPSFEMLNPVHATSQHYNTSFPLRFRDVLPRPSEMCF